VIRLYFKKFLINIFFPSLPVQQSANFLQKQIKVLWEEVEAVVGMEVVEEVQYPLYQES